MHRQPSKTFTETRKSSVPIIVVLPMLSLLLRLSFIGIDALLKINNEGKHLKAREIMQYVNTDYYQKLDLKTIGQFLLS